MAQWGASWTLSGVKLTGSGLGSLSVPVLEALLSPTIHVGLSVVTAMGGLTALIAVFGRQTLPSSGSGGGVLGNREGWLRNA